MPSPVSARSSRTAGVTSRRQTPETFDVIVVPLTDAYRPVASGAYSLAETYGLTVEAFEDALARLAPGGLLVATRWLQIPPSEDLRLVATLAEALARRGVEQPGETLVAYRGIQTLTVLAKPDGWQPQELERVREFARSRRYDLVWAPGIQPEETNRFNRMPTSEHYEAVRDLLGLSRRAGLASTPVTRSPSRRRPMTARSSSTSSAGVRRLACWRRWGAPGSLSAAAATWFSSPCWPWCCCSAPS